MIVLAIDPGLQACGTALFKNADLVAAAWVKAPFPVKNEPNGWRAMAQTVGTWADRHVNGFSTITTVAFEQPGAYRTDTPSSTLILQGLLAIDVWICALYPDAQYIRYFPRDWKGTISPEIICQRAWDRLGPLEQAKVVLPCKSRAHNVLDAIGIGLKAVGRFELARVA
jgi:hypothetical protein